MEIELFYEPLKVIGGNVSERDFDLYMNQPKWASVAKKFAIEPLENSMKEKDKEEFDFGKFKVTRKMQKRTSTSWQGIYNSLLEFLRIRASDSRELDMPGLNQFEGIGYCILTDELKKAIEAVTKQNTSKLEFPQLYWPKAKEEYAREIVLPEVNYRKITPENARIVLTAKRFCSGLEKEVVEAFKQANQNWFEQETSYSIKNLPVKDDSPIRKIRRIARGKPIFIQLVREEEPEYKEIIGRLLAELDDLENGVILENCKTRREKEGLYVNIKNIQDRLSRERLEKDALIKTSGRYEIVP